MNSSRDIKNFRNNFAQVSETVNLRATECLKQCIGLTEDQKKSLASFIGLPVVETIAVKSPVPLRKPGDQFCRDLVLNDPNLRESYEKYFHLNGEAKPVSHSKTHSIYRPPPMSVLEAREFCLDNGQRHTITMSRAKPSTQFLDIANSMKKRRVEDSNRSAVIDRVYYAPPQSIKPRSFDNSPRALVRPHSEPSVRPLISQSSNRYKKVRQSPTKSVRSYGKTRIQPSSASSALLSPNPGRNFKRHNNFARMPYNVFKSSPTYQRPTSPRGFAIGRPKSPPRSVQSPPRPIPSAYFNAQMKEAKIWNQNWLNENGPPDFRESYLEQQRRLRREQNYMPRYEYMCAMNEVQSVSDDVEMPDLVDDHDNQSVDSNSSDRTDPDMPDLIYESIQSDSDDDNDDDASENSNDEFIDLPDLIADDEDDSDDEYVGHRSGYMNMAKSDSDSENAKSSRSKDFPIFNRSDLIQWVKMVKLFQQQRSANAYLILVQEDARTFTPSEQSSVRAMLRTGHAAELNFDVAIATYSTGESIKYCTTIKEKAIRKYHEEQQILWANITKSVQGDIGARMYIDELVEKMSDTERMQMRGTELLKLLPARFTKDTAIERQRLQRNFLALQMKPGQNATRFCSVIEDSFLRLVQLEEYNIKDIDKICVPRLLSALHDNDSYRELATAIQLQLDGVGVGTGLITKITWDVIKIVVHKRDIDRISHKRDRPPFKEKSPKPSPRKSTPNSSGKKAKVVCNYCHNTGHYEAECRKKLRSVEHAKVFDSKKPYGKRKTYGNKTWVKPGTSPKPPNEWKCVKCGRQHPRNQCPLNSKDRANALSENLIPDEYFETSSYINNEETMSMFCEVCPSDVIVTNFARPGGTEITTISDSVGASMSFLSENNEIDIFARILPLSSTQSELLATKALSSKMCNTGYTANELDAKRTLPLGN